MLSSLFSLCRISGPRLCLSSNHIYELTLRVHPQNGLYTSITKGAGYMETKTITDIINLDSILEMVESAGGIEENLVLNKITRSINCNIRRMASDKFDTEISEETA